MNYGYCPSCMNKLTDESVIITRPSEIFKGNSVYMICKNCQRVVLYNKDRDMMFDLDEYQDDEAVLEEISRLLESLNYEVSTQEQSTCQSNCAACAGCSNDYKRPSRKPERQTPVEPEAEPELNMTDKDIHMALSDALLAVNKDDVSIKKIFLIDDLNDIDINDWLFFSLEPVKIKPIISYEIKKI